MEAWEQNERRRYFRIEKHFIISYYDKSIPAAKHNISQIKNISVGGMCFITSFSYAKEAKIGIELKTPYLDDTLHLDGIVLECIEKIPKLIYETHLVFENLSSEAEYILNRTVDYFKQKK